MGFPLLVSTALLLWPALLNGYPLVFSDTGTYLSQAVNHHLGWDRPVFYSFFLLALHQRLTTWPAIVAQASVAAYMLGLARRFSPWPRSGRRSNWWLVSLTAGLALASPLPWFASELMPDLFTSLLVLALALLVMIPERLNRAERAWLVAVASFGTAAHLSSPPLALALLVVLVPLRRRLGAATALGRAGLVRLAAAPLFAVLAMTAVNAVARGVVSLSPYGNVFLLARIIYDGPGMDALRRDCPTTHWRLCDHLAAFPGTADDFLWRSDSPLALAGGAPRISAEADAIITAAILGEPGRTMHSVAANAVRQLLMFTTGDGIRPWPATVTPWIEKDFPAFERASYAASRQTEGLALVPDWLLAVHIVAAISAVLVCITLLPGTLRRHEPLAGLVAAVLLALLVNALVTGGLSGPHARYQSRMMWLPGLVALLAAPGLRMPGLGYARKAAPAPAPAQ